MRPTALAMRPAIAAFLLLVAGCVDEAAQPSAPGDDDADIGSGVPFGAPASDAARSASTVLFPIDHRAVEPSIAITQDGTLLVMAAADVVRSADGGTTWEVVQSAPGGITFDPWISTDPITDRVFVDHLTVACTNIAWTDDAGSTWTPFSPVACGAPVTDFQKLAHGPPGPEANALAGVAYPSVTYICYNKVVSALGIGRYGTACAASYDGGASFQNEAILEQYVQGPAGPVVPGCSGGAWGPVVGPDGTVVVRSQPNCMFRSRDSGLSWERVGEGPNLTGTQFAFDASGVLYAISQFAPPLQMSRSTDQGETWSEPWNIAPPDVRWTEFTAIVAGDAGRVAVAFLGANDTFEDSDEAPETTKWHAYIVAIEGADTDAPAMVAHRATPDDAPMHVGCISRASPCPFLGDFVTMAIHPDGTPYVAFPDTCNEGCEGNPDATLDDAQEVLASVVALRGWSLRA